MYFVTLKKLYSSKYSKRFAKKLSAIINPKYDVNTTYFKSIASNMSYENINETQDFSSAIPSAGTLMTTIDDVTITIKSTKRFHNKRVDFLVNTWMKKVLNQV